MKMAKASQEDIEMTLELCRSLEDLEKGYLPAALSGEDEELPIWYDEEEDSDRVVQHLLAIFRKGSAFRVAFGMAVMLDPRNEVVDPDADCLELHPKFDAAMKDTELLEWLMRNVSGAEFRRLGVTYGGNCGRDRIDAAMAETSNAKVTGRASAACEGPLDAVVGPQTHGGNDGNLG